MPTMESKHGKESETGEEGEGEGGGDAEGAGGVCLSQLHPWDAAQSFLSVAEPSFPSFSGRPHAEDDAIDIPWTVTARGSTAPPGQRLLFVELRQLSPNLSNLEFSSEGLIHPRQKLAQFDINNPSPV